MCRLHVLSIFQSTLPRGSDLRGEWIESLVWISIHAPSRERPVANGSTILSATISIHAPSRERQKETPATADYANISIHAPSRERQKACIRFKSSAPFQSTLPRGSDFFSYITSNIGADFNPRSLAGATLLVILLLMSMLFQSTLPRGSDRETWSRANPGVNFNPRSLAGATESLHTF